MMQIRYSCNDLTALSAAYIALTSIPPLELDELHLEIPASSPSALIRELDSKGFKGVILGNLCIGFTLLCGSPEYMIYGCMVCIVGGVMSIFASLWKLYGWWIWIMYQQTREERRDLVRLEKVLRAVMVDKASDASRAISNLTQEKKEGRVVEFQTRYGLLITERAEEWEGYEVILRMGQEGDEVSARLERVGKAGIKGVQEREWMRVLSAAMREGEDSLLSLYR
jgi:hypothetical protein